MLKQFRRYLDKPGVVNALIAGYAVSALLQGLAFVALRTGWSWAYSINLPALAELSTGSWACSCLMLRRPQRHTR